MAWKDDAFEHECLLVCEGPEDVAFIRELSTKKAIKPISFSCIGAYRTGRGASGLRKHLERLVVNPGMSGVNHIGLLLDIDVSVGDTFPIIQRAINLANGHRDVKRPYQVPDAPYIRKAGTGKRISTTVILQPVGAASGCLETHLWDIFQRKHGPDSACVDALLQCSGIDVSNRWNDSKRAKARIRAGIAVTNRNNPARSLQHLWEEEPNLIPLDDPIFDPLVAQINAI